MRFQQLSSTALALLASLAAEAAAQLPNPSARSFGLAGSYTARARGFEAPFWNPANLGLPGGPSWSLGVAGASAYLNNNSLTYGQIADLYGEFIDDQTKSELLADIRRNDPDRMFKLTADLGAHALALSIGRFAFGLGTIGGGSLEVSPDAMELLLFGNVGEDGTGKDFNLDGSHAQAWSISGALISFAHPFTIPALDYLDLRFSVGASLKYGVAHGLIRLNDRGSVLTSQPLGIQVDAEVLRSDGIDAGRVWALDLGTAMEWGALTAGLSLQNALANIGWDAESFELDLVSASADFDSTTSSDTTLAFGQLTEADQGRVIALLNKADVPKRLRLGVAYRANAMLTVSGDYVELIGGSLRTRWERELALGGELRPIPHLPLRAGLATNFEDLAVAGGIGIYSGPVHFDLSAGRYGVPSSDGLAVALSVSIWPGAR